MNIYLNDEQILLIRIKAKRVQTFASANDLLRYLIRDYFEDLQKEPGTPQMAFDTIHEEVLEQLGILLQDKENKKI